MVFVGDRLRLTVIIDVSVWVTSALLVPLRLALLERLASEVMVLVLDLDTEKVSSAEALLEVASVELKVAVPARPLETVPEPVPVSVITADWLKVSVT